LCFVNGVNFKHNIKSLKAFPRYCVLEPRGLELHLWSPARSLKRIKAGRFNPFNPLFQLINSNKLVIRQYFGRTFFCVYWAFAASKLYMGKYHELTYEIPM